MGARLKVVLERLDARASYEKTADPRHLSALSAIRRLLADLGNPERSFRCVHVAGTLGKGLTAAMIASILTRDGEKTGLYTSPWVRDVREEIQVDGEWISEEDFARLAGTVLDLAESYGESVALSRFDLVTATAFLAFSEAEVDWAVVEAGLGGRLDSTNVLEKDLAVVTRIDYDHTAILGGSLAEIADHKLGILRSGTAVVLAEQEAALAEQIRDKLAEEDRRSAWSREIAVRRRPEGGYELEWPDGKTCTVTLPPHRPEETYLECARTALLSRWILASEPVSQARRSTWVDAALDVSLPGRLSYLRNVSWEGGSAVFETVVLDGCHSPASIGACVRQLDSWGLAGFTLILGIARDKLTEPVRRPLAGLCLRAGEVVLTSFESPRAIPPADGVRFLTEADPRLRSRLRTTDSTGEALTMASADPRRPLVIAGSFYLIREILPGLGPGEDERFR